jgi:hypothetical protein
VTEEKIIALLGFSIFAFGLLATFPPLAQYSEWFRLAASLTGAFIGSWFGVKPIVQARSASIKKDE